MVLSDSHRGGSLPSSITLVLCAPSPSPSLAPPPFPTRVTAKGTIGRPSPASGVRVKVGDAGVVIALCVLRSPSLRQLFRPTTPLPSPILSGPVLPPLPPPVSGGEPTRTPSGYVPGPDWRTASGMTANR